MRLALQPRGGWINAPKVALDSVAVLVGSGNWKKATTNCEDVCSRQNKHRDASQR